MGLGLVASLASIMVINLVLSGDNAVVIALATLRLQPEQRRRAIFWGTFGAVSLRVLLTAVAAMLLTVPYVQAVGGLLLTWIAIKLLAEDEEEEGKNAPESLAAAVRTIIFADLLMSLDNVLAVAGASGGNLFLLVLGLLLSIPLVIWGSAFLSELMQRRPWLVAVGAGLLGWTAGEMVLKEPYLAFLREKIFLEYLIPAVLAVGVTIAGTLLARRKKAQRS